MILLHHIRSNPLNTLCRMTIVALTLMIAAQPALGAEDAKFGSKFKKFGASFKSVKPAKLKGIYVEGLCEQHDFSAINRDSKTLSAITPLPGRWEARGDILLSTTTSTFLAGVRNRLFTAWPCEGTPPEIDITSQRGYNATATADGHVIVGMGLLEAVETEDELAFFVAHEMAHVLTGHLTGKKQLESLTETIRLGMEIRRVGGTAKKMKAKKVPGKSQGKGKKLGNKHEFYLEDPEEVRKLNGETYAIMNDVMDVATVAMAPQWSRQREDLADLVGIDLMARAGYSLAALELGFQKLYEANHKNSVRLKETNNRLNGIKEKYSIATLQNMTPEQQQGFQGFLSDPQGFGKSRSDKLLKSLKKDLRKDAIKMVFGGAHRKPDARMDRLRRYIGNFHRSNMKPLMNKNKSAYASNMVSGDFVALKKISISLRDANASLAVGDFDTADKLVRQASGGRNSNFARLRLLKAQIREQQGRKDLATQNLELALLSPYPGQATYEGLALDYLEQRRYAAVLATVSKGEKRYNDKVHFLPERINVALQLKKNDEAEAYYKQCQDSKATYILGPCLAAIASPRTDFRANYEEILEEAGCKDMAQGASGASLLTAKIADALASTSLGKNDVCFYTKKQ